VENAIEISYKALEENPDKRVFLLSQMIHNQEVNQDLEDRGIHFLMDTDGTQFIPFSDLTPNDVVIIPAFGTTIEIENKLIDLGIEVQQYNTTCPFVEKVWKRSAKLGEEKYTVIIHGKAGHEETRATFSHSMKSAPSVIIRDMKEAELLGEVILGTRSIDEFYKFFKDKISPGFDPAVHLDRIGVVNQTTMLASETQSIADYFKNVMRSKFNDDNHFADTRDTLCYATNDNQDATYALLDQKADLALVIGGYNSSNTSHIAELCEGVFPTFFINGAKEIISSNEIHHYDHAAHEKKMTRDWLPQKQPITIILTSGASCPDTIVDRVMERILEFFPEAKNPEEVVAAMG
jgi:4-hydroxy-3-methylbut-2-en-1-yl diphosphate reductase